MAGFTGQKTLLDNLVFLLDFNNPKSYVSGSAICTNLLNKNITGSLINSPVFDSNEKSLVFDGTDDYIDFDFDKPEICTFILWAKHTGGDGEMVFNAGEHNSGPNLYLTNNILAWNTWNGDSNSFKIANNEKATRTALSDWTHIALVNDNSLNPSKITLYINGVLQGYGNYVAANVTNTLYIGGSNTEYMFDGQISKFQIYNKALTREEVIENYESSYEQHIYNKPEINPLIDIATPTNYTNAYEILQNNPNAPSGYYTIKNPNINNGNPFLIYADMEYNGGGWTLLVYNPSTHGWDASNTTLRNPNLPPNGYDKESNYAYSILAYGDALKNNPSSFEYRIEASSSQSHGGIWSVSENYSFTSSVNTNTNITLDTKFGTWEYNGNGIEERMPYVSTGNGLLTTSQSPNSGWWGTLIAKHNNSYTPAPWTYAEIQNPGRIWYWVR